MDGLNEMILKKRERERAGFIFVGELSLGGHFNLDMNTLGQPKAIILIYKHTLPIPFQIEK